jgi:hypothetical protein
MLNDGGDKLEAHFAETLHDKLAGGRADPTPCLVVLTLALLIQSFPCSAQLEL